MSRFSDALKKAGIMSGIQLAITIKKPVRLLWK